MSEVILGGAQAQTEATSETPKFTPGPWVLTGVSQDDGSISIGSKSERVVIARVTNAASFRDFIVGALSRGGGSLEPSDATTQYANADLIKASPDLYQSVLDLLDIVDTSHPSAPAFIDEARAALRKAEGGE